MEIRLQKHMADLGICSRRKAEELIAEGKVKVNGKVVTELGTKVDPKKDTVTLRNKLYNAVSGKKIYIALNKPIDYISSASSEQGQTVLDLITPNNNIKPKNKIEVSQRVYPIGRLDKDSEGLILLTNDGDLTNQLTHPRYEHEKEYEVTIDKRLERDAKQILAKGLMAEGEFLGGMKILKELNLGKKTRVTLILKEGKNRHIRRMFGTLGYHVVSLKRTRINKLKLGTLPVGKWRLVKKSDII